MSDCRNNSDSNLPFDIRDVARLDGYAPRRVLPDSYYTDCHVCGDRRGKMNINVKKGMWHCNYCGAGGGPLALYAKPRRITTEVAFYEICAALYEGDSPTTWESHANPPIAAPQRTLSEAPAMPTSVIAGAADVHKTLSTLLSLLQLKPKHREELHRRGLVDEWIDELGYKSTPAPFLCPSLCARLVELGCVLRGVPGFYVNNAGVWTIRFGKRTAGFMVPCKGMNGLICGAQIRLDVPLREPGDNPKKKGTKYLWLSSVDKFMGVTSCSPLHFTGELSAGAVYVTEGLLKADIAHYLTGRTFIAIAGANNVEKLDVIFAYLAAKCTCTIVEAFDMDKYRNTAVHCGANKIYCMAKKQGLDVIQLSWNPNYNGIDDWRWSLKRRELTMAKPPKFKEAFLLGTCDVEDIADFAALCDTAQQKQPLWDFLGLSESEYELYRQYGENKLRQELLRQRKEVKYRVYQLDFQRTGAPKPFAFADFNEVLAAEYTQPPASEYSLACEGVVFCGSGSDDLSVVELLRTRYSENLPEDYKGRSIAPSDVIELYGAQGRRYYYCNKEGAVSVKFSALLTSELGECA